MKKAIIPYKSLEPSEIPLKDIIGISDETGKLKRYIGNIEFPYSRVLVYDDVDDVSTYELWTGVLSKDVEGVKVKIYEYDTKNHIQMVTQKLGSSPTRLLCFRGRLDPYYFRPHYLTWIIDNDDYNDMWHVFELRDSHGNPYSANIMCTSNDKRDGLLCRIEGGMTYGSTPISKSERIFRAVDYETNEAYIIYACVIAGNGTKIVSMEKESDILNELHKCDLCENITSVIDAVKNKEILLQIGMGLHRYTHVDNTTNVGIRMETEHIHGDTFVVVGNDESKAPETHSTHLDVLNPIIH